ncbi:putative T7SS-secreted protein [Streptomyces sp. NPDC088116]|uniref:putative T7SS-secreted protein n=1 Tax=Streptomyces sp. NPDC088116 TaxID=3365825 RepID=UPI00381BB086
MVDWGGLADKVVDGVDKGIDKGKEVVGEGVDWTTDRFGEVLDRAGAHDWADAVTDWGDETASSLGAKVGEQQLGQSEEANELIPWQSRGYRRDGKEPAGFPEGVRPRRRRHEEARLRPLERRGR